VIEMNSRERLFVTPEERARRLAASGGQRSAHPHGGEGRCGGKEGHGTPELVRNGAERRQGGAQSAPKGNAQANVRAERSGNGGTPAPKPSRASDTVSVANAKISGEQLANAMKLSFALGEPACRRYGMGSPFRRK